MTWDGYWPTQPLFPVRTLARIAVRFVRGKDFRQNLRGFRR